MSTFLLIRHGSNDSMGRFLAGRTQGIHLNHEGRVQAQQLVERLSLIPVERILSSPMERCRETAAPLSEKTGLEVAVSEDFTEVDFGQWAGQKMEDLRTTPAWRSFRANRGRVQIPGGELMLQVQQRMVGEVERLRQRFPDSVTALFSHGDPIRTVLAHYLGIPLDLMNRLEIKPASVSVLEVSEAGPRLIVLNDTGRLVHF